MRRDRLFSLLVATLLTAIGLARGAEPAPPNVVLIVTDDQGYGDVGFHGNPHLRTPNLDDLARESFRLTNFHVDPTCAETRAALMTGRYSARVGVWHTIRGRSILREDETTLADLFRSNGYATAILGKWHLGDNYPFRPQDRGFDRSVVHGGGGVGQTPDAWGNDYFDDTYLVDGEPTPHRGYCTDVFFDRAIEFLRDSRDEPFFCYLATNAAHAPYRVDAKYATPYLDAGVPEAAANFYGMIANLDENVGRLREEIARLGLAERTILIFMTDNGTAAGFDAGMRGRKGSQYEGGHRVPCFVHAPGQGIPKDRESDLLAAHFDLAPTLVELCDLRLPDGIKPFDGTSLASVLRGDPASPALEDRVLFVHSQRRDLPEKWRKTSVMRGRLRLVDDREFHDLATDPAQKTNLIDERPVEVAAFRAAYDRLWADVSTRFDEPSRIVLGADAANPTTLNCHDWVVSDGEPDPPWSQDHVARNPAQNGEWVVRVAQAGRYRFRLRLRPPGIEEPLRADQATLRIAGQEATASVEQGAEEVAIELDLAPSEGRLRATLRDATGTEQRGAYFVVVERLGGDAELKRFQATRPAMGVMFTFTTYAPDLAAAEPAIEAAYERVRAIDAIATDYDPESELCRLSRRPPGEATEVSETLFALLSKSMEIAEASDGRFDPTLGPLTKLWRAARKAKTAPDADVLAEALSRTGYRKLTLDRAKRTVAIAVAGMQLDLGGIAKGYAADEALRVLRERGFPRSAVAASGDLALGDPPPGLAGWRVGLAPLGSAKGSPDSLTLSNRGVSTSGDATQFVEIEGKRYSHILDPRTGLGVTLRSGASVVAPDSATADAWATAVSVAGPEASGRMLAGVEGVSARIVHARPSVDAEEPEFAEFRTESFPPTRPAESSDP